jgi:ferredoxin
MDFRVMLKESIPGWVEYLAEDSRLIGPVPFQGSHVFAEIHSADEIDWGYPTTILPPKKALLPQREDLLSFDLQQNRIEAVDESQPTILLGVHTCDLYAIHMLDHVFRQDYADQHYLARREQVTIVSIECLEPCTSDSFCKDMGTLNVPDDFDLHLTDLGDAYIVDIGSSKGLALIDDFPGARQATSRDRERFNRIMSSKWPRFQYRLQADVTELPSLLALNYKSTTWNELERKCLGCGSCNIVCPTCYCFDVRDEIDLAMTVGKRYRTWDSCQLNQFASVAGGHDFRPGRASRQRHRFLRKYRYQSVAPGLVGCVGCGRCAQACLVNISPVEVLNTLYQRSTTKIRG